MTKPNRTAKNQANKKTQPRLKTNRVPEPAEEFVPQANLNDERTIVSSCQPVQNQMALRLNDPHIPITQRRALATQIGQMQGNGHLQRMIGPEVGQTVGGSMINPVSRSAAGPTPAFQRFVEKEHKTIGDEATKGEHGELKSVELAEDYRVTYGEMVAMAGDHFSDINQMRNYAQNLGPGAGSREEIEYVRIVKIHGRDDKATIESFSSGAREAADKRYYELAGENRSHFLNPKAGDEDRSTADKAGDVAKEYRGEWYDIFNMMEIEVPLGAGAGYRQNHVRALFEGYFAGISGSGIDSALAAEAFSNHYLSDAFSSGHVRTARASIADHWNQRIPLFYPNLKGYIAEKLAEQLEKVKLWGAFSEEAIYKGPLWFSGSLSAVTEELEKKGGVTFGSFVSGAIHDYDNQHGVKVSIDGQDATLFGDEHLGQGDEKSYAIKAVSISYKEVEKVWELGQAKKGPLEVYKAIVQDGLFAAEKLLPKPKPDSDQSADQQRIKWDYDDVKDLLADSKFREALKIFCENKAGEFETAAKGFDDEDQRDAFMKQIVEPLKATPVDVVWQVINWTPDTGGGVFGHNQDDNALDYYEQAKDKGAMETLTVTQKISLIIDLVRGATMGDEEDAIWDMLTIKESDARAIIDWVGWDRLESEIGNKFKNKFPEKSYGK